MRIVLSLSSKHQNKIDYLIFIGLELHQICPRNRYDIIPLLGMTGFDGRAWPRIASREAPFSLNQRKILSANRTDYAALPLAA
jgi:hypothetical protein